MTIRLMMVMTMLYQTIIIITIIIIIIAIIKVIIIIMILGGSCPLITNLMFKETRIENNHEIVNNILKYHVSGQFPIEKNCS